MILRRLFFQMTVSAAVLTTAPAVHAEFYQYQNTHGQIVASKQLPPLGTTYAVLDDNGVYQYLVHSTAGLMPKIAWQVSTISEQADTDNTFSILQAPLTAVEDMTVSGGR